MWGKGGEQSKWMFTRHNYTHLKAHNTLITFINWLKSSMRHDCNEELLLLLSCNHWPYSSLSPSFLSIFLNFSREVIKMVAIGENNGEEEGPWVLNWWRNHPISLQTENRFWNLELKLYATQVYDTFVTDWLHTSRNDEWTGVSDWRGAACCQHFIDTCDRLRKYSLLVSFCWRSTVRHLNDSSLLLKIKDFSTGVWWDCILEDNLWGKHFLVLWAVKSKGTKDCI